MIRILIADDHAIVRRGLRQIVEQQPDMQVQGEAQNAAEALRLVRKEDWDVVVLDVNMPGRSGLEVLADMRQHFPRVPVLILSVHPEEQYALRALKAGASGYMTKDTAPDELVKAIRKVHSGGKYVSGSVAERLAGALNHDSAAPLHEGLTDREYQVLCLIGAGNTVGQIAEQLCLSIKTISTYRVRMLKKMRMKHNAELIRYAIQTHIVD